MKISKARLLEIIREEVELHEKNTFELDEESLQELTNKQILDKAIEDTEGIETDNKSKKDDEENIEEIELEESGVEEDALYTHKKDPETGKHLLIPPKKNKSPHSKILSVKLDDI